MTLAVDRAVKPQHKKKKKNIKQMEMNLKCSMKKNVIYCNPRDLQIL